MKQFKYRHAISISGNVETWSCQQTCEVLLMRVLGLLICWIRKLQRMRTNESSDPMTLTGKTREEESTGTRGKESSSRRLG